MKQETYEKWKAKGKLWLRLILNWRFVVCFGIAWLITNGWSYILLGIGTLTETAWMTGIALAYLAFLWLPISPEKIVTVAISLFLVRRLFPKHNNALRQQIAETTGSSSRAAKTDNSTPSNDTPPLE